MLLRTATFAGDDGAERVDGLNSALNVFKTAVKQEQFGKEASGSYKRLAILTRKRAPPASH